MAVTRHVIIRSFSPLTDRNLVYFNDDPAASGKALTQDAAEHPLQLPKDSGKVLIKLLRV